MKDLFKHLLTTSALSSIWSIFSNDAHEIVSARGRNILIKKRNIMTLQNKNNPEKKLNLKSLLSKSDIEELMNEYNQEIGSDSIVGLHVCDNFKKWMADKIMQIYYT